MKKTLLAVAIPAALFANAVSAVELYNDEVNTFSVGGHLSAGLVGSDEGSTEVNSVSPRINMEATRDLGNGVVFDAKAEWSVNMLDGGENSFTTRLGYLGVTHEDAGRLAVGTQWAPYYDVAGVADMPIAFANDFLYDDHGSIGTGRADSMVSYRNGIELGESAAINLGLGWQGRQDSVIQDIVADYGNRGQVTVSADLAGFSVGYAYNSGNVDYNTGEGTVSADSQLVSANYGTYGSGLYVAVVAGQNKNVYSNAAGYVLDEANNYEAILAYALANSLNLSINYEAQTDETSGTTSGDTVFSQSAIQAEYNFLPNVVGYVGYQVDLGSDLVGHKDDNMWMIGGRIYL